MKNPSNSLELCDGTMVTSDDSAEFYFENYNGDESNRLSFVGSTEKDYLIFQAEGPLAAELKEDFQGSDFPSCQIMMLPYHLAVKYLVACPKGIFGGVETKISSKGNNKVQKYCADCCVFRSRYCECR